MVLTEAFAAGTPVLASNIAGYADVVSDGVDGILVPPADPQRLAEELQSAQPRPRAARPHGHAPRASRPSATPGRGSPRRSRASTSARSPSPAPRTAGERGSRAGSASSRSTAAPRSRRDACPRSTPPPRRPSGATGPRAGSASASPGASASASPSSPRSGSASTRSSTSIVRSDLDLGPGRDRADDAPRCSCARARGTRSPAPPCRAAPLRRRDVTSATMIGVLMSATLPARLGEPARAMVLARRIGPDARDLPGAARHAGLADRAQHRRAGAARRDHRLARPTSSTPARSDSSCSASRRCCCWSRSCSRRPSSARAAPAGSRAWSRRSAAPCCKVRTGLRRLPRPAPRAGGGVRAARRLGPAAARLLRAVHRARPRPSRSGSAPRPRSCSRSTSPR